MKTSSYIKSTLYHNIAISTSVGQDDNFFSVSSSAETYSVEASFSEYIYTGATTLK